MSYGQELTKRFLVELIGIKPIKDHRPDWLNGLEIDLYWPDLKLAVEFQGDQHYVPVYGRDMLRSQIWRDREKRKIMVCCGIQPIQIRAIDLQYAILSRKLKVAGKRLGRPLRIRKPNLVELKKLNKLAVEYRKTLKENFTSPSSRKSGPSRLRELIKWKEENGVFVDPNQRFKLKRMEDGASNRRILRKNT